MKSLKVKLVSVVSAFILALSLLIVGVWAVGQSQTITMEGSVNFNVADKSLYVKDVRMQEDVNSAPYSLKDQDRFMPGFINGNFDMNLGDFTNSYGSFALYFDIINTMDETTNETFAYTVEQPTAPSGTTVSVSILDTDGTTLEQIPQGTVKPSEISDSTLVTATIKLTIASTSSSSVDLGEITITINQFIPQIYDYFTFKVNDDNQTVTLTDYDSSLSGSTDVVIPSTVSQNSSGEWIEGNTYTVTAIAGGTSSTGVFYDSGITSVTFPLSLTSIGSYAFYGCSKLTSISLSSSLTSIGSYAFYYCSGLTSISLPSSLTSIGDWAFYYCSGLTGELNLGGCTSLISIGRHAFEGCSGLTSLTLPSSITSIGSNAFGSTNINVVNYNGTLSDWLKVSISTVGAGNWIASHRFIINGEELINLEVPEGVESINKGLFSYCSGLKSVTLPSTLKTIGEKAFSGCTKLTSISLPSSLTSIGSFAFYGCSGLTSVDLRGCTSLTSIERYAFSGCTKLTSVDLSGCTSLTSIEDDAFSGCTKLTSVNLSGCTSLTSIGSSAFEDCSGLTSVDLSGCTSLTSIERYAFRDCRGLTSLDLSGCTNLTSIGRYAFYGCDALESVVFPVGSTGWYVTQDETATSGTSVDVKDSSINASNLTDTYDNYYWKRNA